MNINISRKAVINIIIVLVLIVLSAVIIKATIDVRTGEVNNDKPETAESGDAPDDRVRYITPDGTSTVDLDDVMDKIRSKDIISVRNITDSSLLASEKEEFRGAGRYSSEGYFVTDGIYDASSYVIASRNLGIDYPSSFSLRKIKSDEVRYVQESNYSEFTPVYSDEMIDAPSVFLYMGYVLVDKGDSYDIYNGSGTLLRNFTNEDYKMAYTRDTNGSPLFSRTEMIETGLKSGDDVVRDKTADKVERVKEPESGDTTVVIKGEFKNDTDEGSRESVREEGTAYYYLGNDGNFYRSEYKDELDGRGLYFDYPKYYGLKDSEVTLSAEQIDRYFKNIDEVLKFERLYIWNYSRYGTDITHNSYEDVLFKRAFNFREGRGCVLPEKYYEDDGSMYFINESGNKAFNTIRQYDNENLDRYIIECLLGPLTTGKESIGYFYYDHGLVRARLETIDYWIFQQYQFKNNGNLRVYSDKEILIDKDGNVFDIPVEYNVKGYSDGMILLEKNGRFGFMDYTGKWIAECIYEYGSAFHEGLAVLKTADGRYGMIDTKGNIAVPFAYDYISDCSDGIIAVFDKDSGWDILNKMTK